MMNKIISDAKEFTKTHPITYSPITSYNMNNLKSNENVYKTALSSLDTIDEKELYEIVKTSYHNILKNVFNKPTEEALSTITNPKLIKCLTHVFNSVNISYDEKIYCNKLVYDYITSDNHDTYIKDLLMMMIKIVNKDDILKLQSINIPESTANYIALAKSSSFVEELNIKRMNFVICQSHEKYMNTQTIVYIYEKMCSNLSPLFIGTMFDVYNDEEYWATNELMEIYASCSLAVLHMLNNSPAQSIKTVLLQYTETFNKMYKNDISRVRFSLKSISSDFGRILMAIEELEFSGSVIP